MLLGEVAGDGWEEGGKVQINTVVVKSSLDLCGKIKVMLIRLTKMEGIVLPGLALLFSMEANKHHFQGAGTISGFQSVLRQLKLIEAHSTTLGCHVTISRHWGLLGKGRVAPQC